MSLSVLQNDALYLLKHPAEYGRELGFDKLRDYPHEKWITDMVWGTKDSTTQGHRGSYKTTCIKVALAEIVLLKRDQNTIFLRKTDNDVTEVIDGVRNILLHPLTQAIHQALTGVPLQLVKSTSKQITSLGYVKPGGMPQLLGIGIKSSLTGKHADMIFTDDIVNILDRRSAAERRKTRETYQELQNVRNPGGRITNTGTPWHKEDAFELMPEPEKWDCYSTGLLDNEKLDELRMQMSPSLFAANYELKHIADEGALFLEPPQFTEDEGMLANGIAHIDAAYYGEDYTAFTCGKRVGDTLYMYGRMWRRHADEVLDICLEETKRLKCAPIYNELNGDKGYLGKEIRNRGFAAFGYTENENKYIKISTHLRKWWTKIVWLRGTDPAYISQIMDYTDAAEHDDAPDSAASVCRLLGR